MEYLGFGLFALFLLTTAWYLAGLMKDVSRNNGSTHGGGYSDAYLD